jgi:hypothetical protein
MGACSYNRAVPKPGAGWDNAEIYRSHLLFEPKQQPSASVVFGEMGKAHGI